MEVSSTVTQGKVALVYYWCIKSQDRSQPFLDLMRFSCKTQIFSSGAEGIRTPDLRRAKALRAFRMCPVVSPCVA
jgi:hypothetical protein